MRGESGKTGGHGLVAPDLVHEMNHFHFGCCTSVPTLILVKSHANELAVSAKSEQHWPAEAEPPKSATDITISKTCGIRNPSALTGERKE